MPTIGQDRPGASLQLWFAALGDEGQGRADRRQPCGALARCDRRGRRREGWPATSITRTGCPFSKARAILASGQSAACQRWNREVVAWLGRHPDVATIFVSNRANARYVQARRGSSNVETAVQGHMALWRSLPATVRNIIVIRDPPLASGASSDCVRRAYAHRRRGGIICSRKRTAALDRDPAVIAARRARSRTHFLDMTRFFCGSTRCYPVIGGALVPKDADHITSTFSRTVGPFMVNKVDDIAKHSAGAALSGLDAIEPTRAEGVLADRAQPTAAPAGLLVCDAAAIRPGMSHTKVVPGRRDKVSYPAHRG